MARRQAERPARGTSEEPRSPHAKVRGTKAGPRGDSAVRRPRGMGGRAKGLGLQRREFKREQEDGDDKCTFLKGFVIMHRREHEVGVDSALSWGRDSATWPRREGQCCPTLQGPRKARWSHAHGARKCRAALGSALGVGSPQRCIQPTKHASRKVTRRHGQFTMIGNLIQF